MSDLVSHTCLRAVEWRATVLPKAKVVAFCYHTDMSQPVKLSDALVLDARLAGEVMERSIAGQVEFWARLGRSVERLLDGERVLQLSKSATVQPLSTCLRSVNSKEGWERTAAWLQQQPFPHYEAHSKKPGLLIRVAEDGTRSVGRFVNREFRPIRISRKAAKPGRHGTIA